MGEEGCEVPVPQALTLPLCPWAGEGGMEGENGATVVSSYGAGSRAAGAHG